MEQKNRIGNLVELVYNKQTIRFMGGLFYPLLYTNLNFSVSKYIEDKNDLYVQMCTVENAFEIRNEIAHLYNINQRNVSILELINEVIKLVSYDSKRKNAVFKSIAKIFEKNNLNLSLIREQGELKINISSAIENGSNVILNKIITAKNITHLKKANNDINDSMTPINLPSFNDDFLFHLVSLLVYKKQ